MSRLALAMGKDADAARPPPQPLDPEEKRLLKVTLCGKILSQCPDFYALILAKAIRRDREVLAALAGDAILDSQSLSFALEDLVQIPEVEAEAGRLDGLFERLAYEFSLQPGLVSDHAYLLGQTSRQRRSLKPDHFRLFFRSLQEVLSEVDFGELDASAVASGWEKLGGLVSHAFDEGYRDAEEEEEEEEDEELGEEEEEEEEEADYLPARRSQPAPVDSTL